MRTLQCVFLMAAIAVPSTGKKVGYVYCSPHDNPVVLTIAYSSPPVSIPVGRLNCGDKVQVLGRKESWLRIASKAGEQYVPMATLSRRKDRFVALDLPLPPEPILQAIPRHGETAIPRLIYSTKAEYTQDAAKAKIHGFVILKLTVGRDGKPRDVAVLHGLGYGLDVSATKAVQSWRFQPALYEGVPYDAMIAVEVEFLAVQ